MDNEVIGIEFNQDDQELLELFQQEFPDCQLMRSKELEGIEILWVAIIPLVGVGIQLGDFILTHVIPKEGVDSSCVNNRKIVFKGKKVFANELVGKTKKEVAFTIKSRLSVDLDFSVDVDKKENEK